MDRLGDEKSGIFICEDQGKGRQAFSQGKELLVACPGGIKETLGAEVA